MKARKLASKVNATTGWLVETWVIHTDDSAFDSVAQVEIFRDRGTWYAWSGSITRPETLRLARALATLRTCSPELPSHGVVLS